MAEPYETLIQAALIDWWAFACKRFKLPEYALFAIPNGGARHKAVAAKLRREGVRAGIPDLCLAVPKPGIAHALYLEMKRKPNKATREQEKVMLYLRSRGYHAYVCYSTGEAIQIIEGYLAA